MVIETYLNERRQLCYYLKLPDVRDDGFYRSMRSFNAFFNSLRSPKANRTAVRQFTYTPTEEIKFKKKYMKSVDWQNLKTFDSIWDFYEFIGYDYKARKYRSGEVMQRWNRNGSYFEVPKRKKV